MDLSKEKWQQLSDHYQSLSDIYIMAYHDIMKPHREIMTANGILVKMMSEVLSVEKQRGVSDKTRESKERVLILMEIVDNFSALAGKLNEYRLVMMNVSRSKIAAESERDTLKAQLENITKAWNQED